MKKYFMKNLEDVGKLLKRPSIDFEGVRGVVSDVLSDVRESGDEALREYTKRFDGVDIGEFLVSEDDIEEACERVDGELLKAFEVAANNIETFHKAELPSRIEVEPVPGVKCFREARAIEKVGLYVPGGTAPLPSTVLMLGIPARVAGCKEIVMCTPPEKDGKVPDIILFAAKLAGVTQVYKVGGAQAIAAMVYGTESVPKVFKVFGPGNQYVTSAKMLLSVDPDGSAIDMPAGPSELLVIADKSARADFVAADLLSQAEHGADSQVVLVSDDDNKVNEILQEIERQLVELPRKKIAEQALSKSFVLVVQNLDEAFEFSNLYAPEHLILNIENADGYLSSVENAGSVFIGPYSCESAGDYASGTNHTLPTYGYARMYSGVNTESFMKQVTFQKISKSGLENLGPSIEKMAESEQLFAHKNAVTIRIND
ncbi:histidinol dehydrogenase [Candidatus Peregrinibacteria bacterium]|jgi:histidinol dehydrogenase|nr:histidinol dehydrogenase [Candidatus Peregrinibacteria bacterium]